MNYQAYLKSDYWKARSAAFKKRTHQRCFICHKTDVQFNVHHKRYTRKGKSILFRERHTDLRLLCDICHMLIHAYNLEEILAKMLFKRKILLKAMSDGNPRDYLEGEKRTLSPPQRKQYDEWKVKTAFAVNVKGRIAPTPHRLVC